MTTQRLLPLYTPTLTWLIRLLSSNRIAIERMAGKKEFEAAQKAEEQYRAFLQREKQSMHGGEYQKKNFGIKTIRWD